MTLAATSASFTGTGSQFLVNGGHLVAVGQNYTAPGPATGPLGGAGITLNNGTLVLAATSTAATTFDMVSGNPVNLLGTSDAIVAAAGPGRRPGRFQRHDQPGRLQPDRHRRQSDLEPGREQRLHLERRHGLQQQRRDRRSDAGNISLAGSNLSVSAGTLGALSGGTLTMIGPISAGTFAPVPGAR